MASRSGLALLLLFIYVLFWICGCGFYLLHYFSLDLRQNLNLFISLRVSHAHKEIFAPPVQLLHFVTSCI